MDDNPFQSPSTASLQASQSTTRHAGWFQSATYFRQAAWFACGAWFVFSVGAIAEYLLRWQGDTDGVMRLGELLLVYVPASLLFAVPYLAWGWLRSRYLGHPRRVTWYVPFILGGIFLPILLVSFVLLSSMGGEREGALAIAALLLLLGYPLAAAELSYDLGESVED